MTPGLYGDDGRLKQKNLAQVDVGKVFVSHCKKPQGKEANQQLSITQISAPPREGYLTFSLNYQ